MSAERELLHLLWGGQVAQVMVAALRLGLFEALREGARDAAQLAAEHGWPPDALHRILEVLAAAGLLYALPDGQHGLTQVGRCLLEGPGSLAPRVLCIREEIEAALAQLQPATQDGGVPFERAMGCSLWEWLDRREERREDFQALMTRSIHAAARRIAAELPVAGGERVVDLGGGRGELLRALLDRHPGLRAVLFDRPSALAEAPEDPRIERQAGDCFGELPRGAQIYLLARVLHGCNDRAALHLLGGCAEVMNAGARLVVVEHLHRAYPPSMDEALPALRVWMLTGGRERSLTELDRMYEAAGLQRIGLIEAGWMSAMVLCSGPISSDSRPG